MQRKLLGVCYWTSVILGTKNPNRFHSSNHSTREKYLFAVPPADSVRVCAFNPMYRPRRSAKQSFVTEAGTTPRRVIARTPAHHFESLLPSYLHLSTCHCQIDWIIYAPFTTWSYIQSNKAEVLLGFYSFLPLLAVPQQSPSTLEEYILKDVHGFNWIVDMVIIQKVTHSIEVC